MIFHADLAMPVHVCIGICFLPSFPDPEPSNVDAGKQIRSSGSLCNHICHREVVSAHRSFDQAMARGLDVVVASASGLPFIRVKKPFLVPVRTAAKVPCFATDVTELGI